MKLTCVFILANIFLNLNMFAQSNQIIIPLKTIWNSKSPLMRENYSIKLDTVFDNSAIWKFSVMPSQNAFEKYLNGDIDSTTFFKYKINPSSVTNKNLNHSVSILTRIIGDTIKEILVDKNFNNNFSDEKIYTYPLKLKEISSNLNDQYKSSDLEFLIEALPIIDLNTEIYADKNILNFPIKFKIMPYNTGFGIKNMNFKRFFISLIIDSYKEGVFMFQNQIYKIAINHEYFFSDNRYSTRVIMSYNDKPYPNIENFKPARIGDIVSIDSKNFKIDSLNSLSDHIFISPLELKDNFNGYNLNNRSPDFDIKTLSGEIISNKNVLKNKYILLDFWGSWCMPCIKTIPQLNEIYLKYSKNDQLIMLGVAFEQINEPKLVKQKINQYSIGWSQTIEYQSMKKLESNYLVNKFNVDIFPTLILIDNDGIIKFRGTGIESVNELKLLLVDELGY